MTLVRINIPCCVPSFKSFMTFIYSSGGPADATVHTWWSEDTFVGTCSCLLPHGSEEQTQAVEPGGKHLYLRSPLALPTHPSVPSIMNHAVDLVNSQSQTWSNVIGNRSWGSVVIHTRKESSMDSVVNNVSSNSSMNSRPR